MEKKWPISKEHSALARDVSRYAVEHVELKELVASHQAEGKALLERYDELKLEVIELPNGTKVAIADQRRCKVADVDVVELAAKKAGLVGIVEHVKKVAQKRLYEELKRKGLHALAGLKLYHVRVLQVHVVK